MDCILVTLEGQTFFRLTKPSVRIRTHFSPQTTENLFDTKIPIPIPCSRQFWMLHQPSPWINTCHVDLWDEFDNRGFSGVVIRASDTKFIESTIMISLPMVENGIQKKMCVWVRKFLWIKKENHFQGCDCRFIPWNELGRWNGFLFVSQLLLVHDNNWNHGALRFAFSSSSLPPISHPFPRIFRYISFH